VQSQEDIMKRGLQLKAVEMLMGATSFYDQRNRCIKLFENILKQITGNESVGRIYVDKNGQTKETLYSVERIELIAYCNKTRVAVDIAWLESEEDYRNHVCDTIGVRRIAVPRCLLTCEDDTLCRYIKYHYHIL
jgi:hypothetical protein